MKRTAWPPRSSTFLAKYAIRGASEWVDGSVEAVCQALHELYERVHGTAGFEDKRAFGLHGLRISFQGNDHAEGR